MGWVGYGGAHGHFSWPLKEAGLSDIRVTWAEAGRKHSEVTLGELCLSGYVFVPVVSCIYVWDSRAPRIRLYLYVPVSAILCPYRPWRRNTSSWHEDFPRSFPRFPGTCVIGLGKREAAGCVWEQPPPSCKAKGAPWPPDLPLEMETVRCMFWIAEMQSEEKPPRRKFWN